MGVLIWKYCMVWPSRYSDELWTWLPGFEFRQGWGFSLIRSVQTGSRAHLASYPIGSVGLFPVGKAAGTWSWPLTVTVIRKSMETNIKQKTRELLCDIKWMYENNNSNGTKLIEQKVNTCSWRSCGGEEAVLFSVVQGLEVTCRVPCMLITSICVVPLF
jgi:hypothetical protein